MTGVTTRQSSEVLVFPREIFGSIFSLLPWNSIQSYLDEIERSFSWLSRSEAELSDDVVQAIPCVVVRDNADRYCVFRRIREGRSDLRGRLSLIVGGHIDDTSDRDCFQTAMSFNLSREIGEEIGIRPKEPPRPVGVIIDGSSIVASRHVAFLHEMAADEVSPSAPEEFTKRSKYTGEFMSAYQLGSRRDEFDPWSRLVIEEYVCPEGVSLNPRQSSFL